MNAFTDENGSAYGEDNRFVARALARTEIDTIEGRDKIVARMHNGMTSPKEIKGPCDVQYGSWRSLTLEQVPQAFFN